MGEKEEVSQGSAEKSRREGERSLKEKKKEKMSKNDQITYCVR